MDRRRAHPWEDQWVRREVTQPDRFTGEGTFTLMPGGLGKWEATPEPPRATSSAPAPVPRAIQRVPVPSAPNPPATPPKDEVTRIFKSVTADTVPTATRAVAEYAIKHALYLHGFQPSMIALQWMQRLAPGATVFCDDEFRGPHNMAGKTRSDGHDGRTVTIILRHDLPLETIAETALHEGFHAVQFLHTPIGMRHDALKVQVEQQAQEFAARHLRDLQGVLASFLRPKRVCSRS